MATALALLLAMGGCEPTLNTNGAGGTILIYVRVCTRTRMTVALRDAQTGRLLRVAGNPYRQRRRSVTMQWTNYCGPRRPLVYELTVGARRIHQRSNSPGARCETAKVPSTLTVFRLRR